MTSITDIQTTGNADIVFTCDGRRYVLLIDQEELNNAFGQTATYWETPLLEQGFNDTESIITIQSWNKLQLSEADLLQVILANRINWEDVTPFVEGVRIAFPEQYMADNYIYDYGLFLTHKAIRRGREWEVIRKDAFVAPQGSEAERIKAANSKMKSWESKYSRGL